MDRTRALHRLARRRGVVPRYRNLEGTLVTASEDALLTVLRAVDPEIAETFESSGAEAALRLDETCRDSYPLDVCHVAWDGKTTLRLRGATPEGASLQVTLERVDDGSGEGQSLRGALRPSPRGTGALVDLDGVPSGIHRAQLASRGSSLETWVVSAPSRAFSWEDAGLDASWGLFAPAYALRDASTRGAGDVGALSRLAAWCTGRGGSIVGTLPLLAPHPDGSPVPSPYSPSSRRFWNEALVDVDDARRRIGGEACEALWNDSGWRAWLRELDETRYVDWNGIARARGRALAALAEDLGDTSGPQRDSFEAWRRARPLLRGYAEHRVARAWWPDHESVAAHETAQWLLDLQIREAGSGERAGLLLDLPLGVHADGFDRHESEGSFASGLSIGAPPDGFFEGGQNWGIAPLDPRTIRDEGYRYLADCLAHQMSVAAALRIDHVMGLFRMFCIPTGSDARDGVYLRYGGEEALAVVSLMSHRHRCVVVGEDLGTVPDYVRRGMEAHGLARTYVAQTSLVVEDEGGGRLEPAPAASQATVGTHDMPSFSGYWEARDVEIALANGTIDEEEASRRRERRTDERRALAAAVEQPEDASPGAVHAELLRRLAEGDASCLVVNLEDLWLEPEPQNVPGVAHDPPSFCRRASWALERISDDEEIARLLDEIDAIRRRKRDASVDEGEPTA